MLGSCRRGAVLASIAVLVFSNPAVGKRPIRTDFFDTYPFAVGTAIESLPSQPDHCGMCHFDFNGGGPRNPYGAELEALRRSGLSNAEAFAILEGTGQDQDEDSFDNLVEITDTVNYSNTPTFPGLSVDNVGDVVNAPIAELSPHLTPTSDVDTDPPDLVLSAPVGGEFYATNATQIISWAADDPSGVASIDIYHSDDMGVTWKPVALGLANDLSFAWFVPHRPGPGHLIRLVATDGAGNSAQDESPTTFTVNPLPPEVGIAPTTLRDMDLPGTQPLEGPVLADADENCATCHGNYDVANEPWANWRGSMMAQAARDPLFLACLAVAEQDAPSVGDLCIRCHSPRAWLGGRSIDTSGGSITAADRQGVSCDFCHKLVDWNYVEGVSPPEDQAVLAGLSEIPQQYGNGQYVTDTSPPKRGPYADALESGHANIESNFHRSSAVCGTCHDVSNPVFDKVGDADYAPNDFDAPHPNMNQSLMAPIERTYSEWLSSDFANGGVDLPQYGGVVSTCQDCHMPGVTGHGSNDPESPLRTDLPLHDMTGGNAFIQDLIPDFFPGEVDIAQLQASKARAISTLQKAARLELSPDGAGIGVRVYNDTGHKLPTGYPEGRRIWLNVIATDEAEQVVYTSGDYDFATGVLTHDEDVKIYQVKPGLSPGLADLLGLPAGPSFHFVLNDSVYGDNRIPPRGFDNAVFEAIQMPPVAYSYDDGQYWDDTFYALPNTAKNVTVRLYYQTVSKEYVEFLQAENETNTAGDDLYAAWDAHGRGAPVLMAEASTPVDIVTAIDDGGTHTGLHYSLGRPSPNPFQGRATFQYSLAAPGPVRLEVYDLRGRRVRVLDDEIRPAGRYTMHWDGRDDRGRGLASGVYFLRYRSGTYENSQRVVLVR